MSDEREREAQSDADAGEDKVSWDDAQEEVARSRDPRGPDEKSGSKEREAAAPPFPNGFIGDEPGDKAPQGNLDFILDIPLRLSVELGRTRMLISDLLKLGQGSVIELAKLVGEPLDILVNGKEIARGEVVVVNEKFGVRLTDIVNPFERVQQLR